ncbi:hypothetical protein MTO96_037565, partial [Rhipicephalus appendiculatus]
MLTPLLTFQMLISLLLNNLSLLVALPSEQLASAQHEVDYAITHLPADPPNVATDPYPARTLYFAWPHSSSTTSSTMGPEWDLHNRTRYAPQTGRGTASPKMLTPQLTFQEKEIVEFRRVKIRGAVIASERAGIENLEQLTSTDVKQAWGKLRGNSIYKPRRVKNLCHVRPFTAVQLDQAKLEKIQQQLTEAAPGGWTTQCPFRPHQLTVPGWQAGEPVWVRNFGRGEPWTPASITSTDGARLVNADGPEGETIRRHSDQGGMMGCRVVLLIEAGSPRLSLSDGHTSMESAPPGCSSLLVPCEDAGLLRGGWLLGTVNE